MSIWMVRGFGSVPHLRTVIGPQVPIQILANTGSLSVEGEC